MATPPTADKCKCQFASSPTTHDWLIGFEEWTSVRAADVIARIIGADDIHTIAEPVDVLGDGTEELDFEYPDTFERFVSQHNWADPVGMAELAHAVTWAAGQAYSGRRTRKAVSA